MKHRVSVVYLGMSFLLWALAVVGPGLPAVRAQQPNRVALVVHFGDGSTATRCVEFGEPDISGYDVLVRSGLNVVAAVGSGAGAAICGIEGTGCGAEDCFCAYPNYWSYWHLTDGNWAYSSVGASGHKAHNGDVEGWSWGEGGSPPVVPFDQICTPPPPTNTPVPTDTPVPPTATVPPPTDTPLPAPTVTAPPPTPVVWFRLDHNPIPVGTCTMVRWDTADASDVYLDGERVGFNGGREVCPSAPREYHLRVVSAVGEQDHTLVLGVTGATPSPAPISQPTVLPPSASPSAPEPATATSPPPSPSPQPAVPVSPSPSPTGQPSPTVSPSPSSNPQRVALAPPSPSPTRATQLALTPSLSSSPEQPMPKDQGPSSTALLGYITFNFILIGLLSWLIVGLLRRR